MKATIHLAGTPQLGGLYQRCARCGHVLQDYTDGLPMVIEGDDPTLPTWTEGRRIAVAGNATWTLAPDIPLDADETECRTAQ